MFSYVYIRKSGCEFRRIEERAPNDAFVVVMDDVEVFVVLHCAMLIFMCSLISA